MNQTTLVLVLAMLLSACAKEEPGFTIGYLPQYVPPAQFALSCTYQTTATYSFVRYPTDLADKYACSGLPRMTCVRGANATSEEVICKNTSPSVSAGTIPGCKKLTDDGIFPVREFSDGVLLGAESYDCGVFESRMRCFYYRGNDGNFKEELVCDPSQMPGPGRTQIWPR